MPRVSVLTPLYNTNPAHLREMIESILNQTFTDFEFLILNDSPQNTEIEEIVKSYKDKRIKYFRNEKNMGITPSRNKLLKMARGEYVAVFDHDDISVPERLAVSVDFLDKNPHIGVVSGWLQFFGTSDILLKNPEWDTDIKICLTENCFVAHTASMIRKSVLTDNNIEYEEYYTPAEDYRLWARLMDVTNFHNLQMVLVKYRMLSTNTTVTQRIQMKRAHDSICLQLQNKYPVYYNKYYQKYRRHSAKSTRFRLRLFGFIPLIKLKKNWVWLFECIPICKCYWR
jgi:glycosyltransferase involved in cell wall biosynthesis